MHRILKPADGLRCALLRGGRVVAMAAAYCAAVPHADSQPTHPATPPELEALYLYNFAKFVTWPTETVPTSAPFGLCTLGSSEFNGALDAASTNEPLQGHRVVVRHLPSIAEAEGCQILFIGPSEDAHLNKELGAVKAKPILTVSSLPDFLDHGGMIQFIVEENRVRFAINLAPATESHLTLSSELLKLAVVVQGKPAEEAK